MSRPTVSHAPIWQRSSDGIKQLEAHARCHKASVVTQLLTSVKSNPSYPRLGFRWNCLSLLASRGEVRKHRLPKTGRSIQLMPRVPPLPEPYDDQAIAEAKRRKRVASARHTLPLDVDRRLSVPEPLSPGCVGWRPPQESLVERTKTYLRTKGLQYNLEWRVGEDARAPSVDIAVHSLKLAIECGTHFHRSRVAQARDAKKKLAVEKAGYVLRTINGRDDVGVQVEAALDAARRVLEEKRKEQLLREEFRKKAAMEKLSRETLRGNGASPQQFKLLIDGVRNFTHSVVTRKISVPPGRYSGLSPDQLVELEKARGEAKAEKDRLDEEKRAADHAEIDAHLKELIRKRKRANEGCEDDSAPPCRALGRRARLDEVDTFLRDLGV